MLNLAVDLFGSIKLIQLENRVSAGKFWADHYTNTKPISWNVNYQNISKFR